MKHFFILLVISLLTYNANAQVNDSLTQDNKAYIENLKKRIDKVEEEINPSLIIAKLRDSIRLLENKISGLEGKVSTPKKAEISEVVLFFDFNKTTLSSQELNKLKQTLSVQKKIKQVLINGYTDSVGTKNINNFISQERANRVKSFLSNSPLVPNDKIFISWHGSKNSEGERKAIVTFFYE